MNIFSNRPLALSCCVFSLTAVLVSGISGIEKLFFLALCLLTGAILAIRAVFRRACGAKCATLLLCLAAVSAALTSSWLFFDLSAGHIRERIGSECDAEGYVTERLETGYGETWLNVRLRELDGERVTVKVQLRLGYCSSLQPGDRFRIRATVPEKQKFTGDGSVGILQCDDYRLCTALPEKQSGWIFSLREWNAVQSDRLRYAIGGEEGDLAAALLLGNRSGLSGDTVLHFRRAGISHLLALSGLHVSALIAVAELLLQWLRVPKKIRVVLIPALSLLYLGLTGCAFSTVRAVLMVCVLYLGFLFEESYDAFTALCAVLMGILLCSPDAVTDISLWMSFFATGAILLFVPAFRTLFESQVIRREGLSKWFFRVLRWLVAALSVGMFANAAVLILTAVFFGYTSVFSVPVTLLLSPFLPVVLAGCALTLVFPALPPLIAVTKFCMRCYLDAAERVSDIPNGTVLLNSRFCMVLVGVLALSMILLAVLKLRHRRWLLIPVLLSVAVVISGYADVLPASSGTFAMYWCQGENEILLLSEGHTAVAIDFSGGSAVSAGIVLNAMKEAHCTELRELVFTHYHAAATSLISSLSAQTRVASVRLPEPDEEWEFAVAARVEQETELHGIPVCYGEGNLPLPETGIEWLRWSAPNRVEAPVLVSIRVHDQTVTYLGSGFSGSGMENAARNFAVSSDLLILGVHGLSQPVLSDGLRLSERTVCVISGSAELSGRYGLSAGDERILSGRSVVRFFLGDTVSF